MSTLSIRIAGENDRSAIRMIAEGTWPTAYGHIISGEQIAYMLDMMYSDASLAEQMQKGHCFYLALLDEAPIGFASISQEGEQSFKLNKLYVLPTIQKTGAGRSLLDTAITHARESDATTLFLQVNKHNVAKGFYEKMGFTIREEIKLDIGNGFFMDDYIMELGLSE